MDSRRHFLMESDKHYREEAPADRVTADGFWMGSHTVTNKEFRHFIEATKHLTSPRKVIKGGSFLRAPNYSRRSRPAARMAQPIDTSTCHLGFRCIIRVRP